MKPKTTKFVARVHTLKTWPEYWELIAAGKKTADLRIADRPFLEGDYIVFEKWDPRLQQFMGETYTAQITHVLHAGDPSGILPENAVLISFKDIDNLAVDFAIGGRVGTLGVEVIPVAPLKTKSRSGPVLKRTAKAKSKKRK